MTLLTKDTFVCIDCETTGLDPEKDQVIEVAAVVFTFDQKKGSFDSLINPRCPIPPSSIEIHHITDEMVEGKPYIEQVLPDVLKLIGSYPIVGHGVQFDIDLIRHAAKRAGIACQIEKNPVLDTLRLARLYGDSPLNGLDQLRRHFNIAAEGAHRALSDVVVNIEVFKHLVAKFTTTKQVLDRLRRPILLKMMPLGKHKGRSFRDIPQQYLQWAASKDFDQDLMYSIRSELKRRKTGGGFAEATSPFRNL